MPGGQSTGALLALCAAAATCAALYWTARDGELAAELLQTATGTAASSVVKARSHKVYVNCNTGSDKSGDGSRKRPFLSPMHARDFLRSMKPYTTSPVDVLIYGDCFPRNPKGTVDFSHAVLELRPGLDSGTRRAPVSYIGGPASRFLSGLPISKSAWSQVNENIYAADLIALGADDRWFGGFLQPDNPGGHTMGRCTSHQAELFFGGKPMTLARYPNKTPEGGTTWLEISHVLDAQKEFQVSDERVMGWAEAGDAWIHGYWSYDWADSFLEVTHVTKDDKTGAANIAVNGPVLYGFSKGAKFYGVNILSELDAPGEYYIDRRAGKIYFYPPASLETNEAYVSLGDYTVVLGGTGEALRDAAEDAEDGAAQSLMEQADRAALSDMSGGAPEMSLAHGLHTAQALDVAAETHDLARHAAAGTAARGARREAPNRNAAAVGWGSWDFWQRRRLLFMKRALADVAVKAEPHAATDSEAALSSAGDGAAGDKQAPVLSFVSLRGISVHFSQVSAVQLVNVENVVLEGLTITNHGGLGLGVDGERVHVSKVSVGYTGCGGMQLSGGETLCMGQDVNACLQQGQTLRDSHNVVEDSGLARVSSFVFL